MFGSFNFAAWRERVRFRSSLSRLIEDPHLAADLGFDVRAVKAERARLPWQPVRLRRGSALREEAPVVTGTRHLAAPITRAAARRT